MRRQWLPKGCNHPCHCFQGSVNGWKKCGTCADCLPINPPRSCVCHSTAGKCRIKSLQLLNSVYCSNNRDRHPCYIVLHFYNLLYPCPFLLSLPLFHFLLTVFSLSISCPLAAAQMHLGTIADFTASNIFFFLFVLV